LFTLQERFGLHSKRGCTFNMFYTSNYMIRCNNEVVIPLYI
jgi:hypothetical protein